MQTKSFKELTQKVVRLLRFGGPGKSGVVDPFPVTNVKVLKLGETNGQEQG